MSLHMREVITGEISRVGAVHESACEGGYYLERFLELEQCMSLHVREVY